MNAVQENMRHQARNAPDIRALPSHFLEWRAPRRYRLGLDQQGFSPEGFVTSATIENLRFCTRRDPKNKGGRPFFEA